MIGLPVRLHESIDLPIRDKVQSYMHSDNMHEIVIHIIGIISRRTDGALSRFQYDNRPWTKCGQS